jgi:hypothetical protein
MHGLAGLQEDAIDVVVTGASALVGASVAKMVTDFAADIGIEYQKDAAGEFLKDAGGNKIPVADTAEKKNTPTLPAVVPPLIPLAVGIGIVWAGDKYKLSGKAKQAALGVAAGMAAYGIAKAVVAVLPKKKDDPNDKTTDKAGDMFAKYMPFQGLGAVDTYDTGLLAGLGQIDATVAAYMNRGLMGSPTQVERLISSSSLAGAPILVQDPRAGMIGSPAIAQQLAGAPLSATLM